jgi:hypothetical protein
MPKMSSQYAKNVRISKKQRKKRLILHGTGIAYSRHGADFGAQSNHQYSAPIARGTMRFLRSKTMTPKQLAENALPEGPVSRQTAVQYLANYLHEQDKVQTLKAANEALREALERVVICEHHQPYLRDAVENAKKVLQESKTVV